MLRAITLSLALLTIGVVSFFSLNPRGQEVLAVDSSTPPVASSCQCGVGCGCGCSQGLACNCQR